MTQTDLAKVAKKTRSTISGYETEGKEPDYATLCLLAAYFGVAVDYLLGVSDIRSHNDVVFVNDTRQFAAMYDSLSHDLKHYIASAFDNFYLILSRDIKLRRVERLALYSELMTLLQQGRADIRNKIEQSSPIHDPTYLSDLMTMQSELKNGIAVLLDQLMQADMAIASNSEKKSASHESSKRSIG